MALRAPFILANEVEDANGRKWRTFHHFKHHDPDDNDFKEHNRDRLHHPSSVASFITAGGGDNLLDYGYEDDPQIAVGFEPGGFVEWTVFDHLGRETEVWATRQQATTPPPASISNFTGTKRLVKRLSYHEPAQINPMGASGTADRPDLVTTVESYRGRDGLSTEANFERTEHEYLVVDAGDSLRGRVKVATSTSYREDVNGPGADVPATTWTGMTDRGDVHWTVDPLGMLTLHTYADRSGALLSTKRNADQAGVPFPTGWTPSPLASAQGGWTADTLTTTRINDSLGRPLRITAEDGTSQVFRYGMEKITYPQSELPVVPDTRLKYFTMWSYPHDLDGLGGANAADGPLVKQWADASMNTIRASKFVVQTFPPAINQAEDGAALGASGTELSRVVHAYATSGALVSTKTRPQINLYTSPSTFVPDSTEYVETFEYDGLGRQISHTDAIGNVTKTSYDVFDRVIRRERSATGSPQVVEEVFYDFALEAGPPSQAAGDGNATLRRVHVSETDVRDTVTLHDWRNRARVSFQRDPAGGWLSADKGTYALVIIDNVGRPIEVVSLGQGDYSSLRAPLKNDSLEPAAALASLPVTGRTTNFYSPRGLVYRSETAIDPTDAGAGILRNDSYFDALGRPIAVVGPSGPVTKSRYDLLGRVAEQVVTDGASARAATATFEQVTDLSNSADAVLERTMIEFFQGSAAGPTRAAGLPYLTTRSVRRVDDTSAGSMAGPMTSPITTYSGIIYDAAARPIVKVEFGTNTATDEFMIGGQQPIGGSSAALAALTTAGNGASQSISFANRDQSLVTELYYDNIGRQDVTRRFDNFLGGLTPESNSVQATRTQFDGLDRPIAITESLDGTVTADTLRSKGVSPPVANDRWSIGDTNGFRVTSMAYDGASNVVSRTAHNYIGSTQSLQTTKYLYSPTNSLITGELAALGNLSRTSGLLYAILYPDPSNGAPSSTPADRVLFAYNIAGEQIKSKDQNGTVREYVRDFQGRVLDDHVTAFGNLATPMQAIDVSIDRISTQYDEFGRMLTIGSYEGMAGPKNEVAYVYDARGRIERITQNPEGPATASSAESVDYVYEDVPASGAAGNVSRSRLQMMHYPATAARPPPERLALSFHYGNGIAADDSSERMSRLSELAWNRPGSTDPLQSLIHRFVGAGRRVKSDFLGGPGQLDVFRDRTLVAAGATTYPGLDRFGRVKEQLWYRDIAGNEAGDPAWSPDTRPPMFQLQYQYDRASQIRRRIDARPGMAPNEPNTESTANQVDRLGRLTRSIRGESPTATLTSSARYSEDWSLDLIGNHASAGSKNGVGTVVTTASTFNSTNEIKVRGAGTPEFLYDHNGNLHAEQVTNDDKFVYTYDAWNRLTKVETQAGTNPKKFRAAYSYYPNHSLATRIADTDQDSGAAPDSRIYFFYDSEWRLLEERINVGAAFGENFNHSLQTGRQYVWDPTGGPNELVQSRVDTSADTTLTFGSSYWAQTDRMHSVIGLVANSASAETGAFDRVQYRAYGMPILAARGDASGNGVTDFADITAALTGFNGHVSGEPPGYAARSDVNEDGVINFAEITAVLTFNEETESTNVSRNGVSSIGYSGSYWDPDARLYLMRHRWYDPELSRFMTRDPAGYVDGMSMYLYAKGNPAVYYDPWGMEAFWSAENYKAGVAAAGQIAQRVGSNVVGQLQGMQSVANDAMSGVGVLTGAIDPQVYRSESEIVGPVTDAVEQKGVVGFGREVINQAVDSTVSTAKGVINGDPEAIGDAITAAGEIALGTKGLGRFSRIADNAGDAAKAAGRVPTPALPEGSFSLTDWTGYPSGAPTPKGPFRLLNGVEYNDARKAANKSNRMMHQSDPSLAGKQIHEIQPVKFGGSPTDPHNKLPLSRQEHIRLTNWWNERQRSLENECQK